MSSFVRSFVRSFKGFKLVRSLTMIRRELFVNCWFEGFNLVGFLMICESVSLFFHLDSFVRDIQIGTFSTLDQRSTWYVPHHSTT